MGSPSYFVIDETDGKSGKFVSTQQNSATLIYDLNRMKDIAHPFKAVQFQAWKSHLVL